MADSRINEIKEKQIVCLGGGIGTANLLRGLKKYTTNINTVISMADDGGSAGRLRRLYNVMPLGDLVSCMSVMSKNKEGIIPELLTYRFNGERYGKDHELGGHKLGNLLMVALKDLSGTYEGAIAVFKKLFDVQGNFFPATESSVDISAITIDGQEIFGEEKIDLGKYRGKRILQKVLLHPQTAPAAPGVVDNILSADVVVLGPGDLYTNLLPVLIVPEIADAVKNTKAKRIFIVNVANKPFETKGYNLKDYYESVKRHIESFPFDIVLVNNNYSIPIPEQYKYTYVVATGDEQLNGSRVVKEDLVNDDFPLYHSSEKLAKAICKYI